jgi:hypothetical protein
MTLGLLDLKMCMVMRRLAKTSLSHNVIVLFRLLSALLCNPEYTVLSRSGATK